MATTPTTSEIIGYLRDIVAPLAAIERTMVMPFDRNRHENVAEHSYMLSMLACALAEHFDSGLDTGKIAQFALVHDQVEIYAGDTSVWADKETLNNKKSLERAAAQRITQETIAFPWLSQTITDYERQSCRESRFVYALDKIVPHMLIIAGDYHPVQPTWPAYKKTEDVATKKISDAYPELIPYFDELCSIFRQKAHFFTKKD